MHPINSCSEIWVLVSGCNCLQFWDFSGELTVLHPDKFYALLSEDVKNLSVVWSCLLTSHEQTTLYLFIKIIGSQSLP